VSEIFTTQFAGLNSAQRNLINPQRQGAQGAEQAGAGAAAAQSNPTKAPAQEESLVSIASSPRQPTASVGEDGPRLPSAESAAEAASALRGQFAQPSGNLMQAQAGTPDGLRQLAAALLS
jgi:hypothetical protein